MTGFYNTDGESLLRGTNELQTSHVQFNYEHNKKTHSQHIKNSQQWTNLMYN